MLAAVFYFAKVPDIKAEDDYHLDDATPGVLRSIWTHPHFVLAVLAQFMYVAAQAGVFSFFIIYMTSEVPNIPASWRTESTKDWIEVDTNFAKHDIKDLPVLAEKLKRKADPDRPSGTKICRTAPRKRWMATLAKPTPWPCRNWRRT